MPVGKTPNTHQIPPASRPNVSIKGAMSPNRVMFEYVYFEGPHQVRAKAKNDFLSGKTELPAYTYPRLQRLFESGEDERLAEIEGHARQAMEVLENVAGEDNYDQIKVELFADYQASRILRLELLRSAWHALMANDADERKSQQHTFTQINNALFGQMDNAAWLKLQSNAAYTLTNFRPVGERAQEIAIALERYGCFAATPQVPDEVLDKKLMAYYRPLILKRYSHILSVVPNTSSEVIYGAEQCRSIMQQALVAGGLDEWQVKTSTHKLVPSTKSDKKSIWLPVTTARTADELRRLILHEQEVHARRGQNGAKVRLLPLLQTGTATYAAAEEGLGLFLELVLSGSQDNPALSRAADRYLTAGLALGLDGGGARNAREVFEILWRLFAVRFAVDGVIGDVAMRAAREQAYSHIENAYRGTDFASPGIIYSKLKIYYEGLMQNIQYMQSIMGDEQAFDDLFIGKYNHTDETDRQRVFSYCKSITSMV